MPLAWMEAGRACRIERITGDEGLRARLHDMGLTLGQELQVLQCLHGNLIILIRGSRLALGRDLSARVLVRAC